MWLSAVRIRLASGSVTTQAAPSWASPDATVHISQPQNSQALFHTQQVPLEATKQRESYWRQPAFLWRLSFFYLSWLWDLAHRTHPGTIEWAHGHVNLCLDGLEVLEIIGGSNALSPSRFHSEHILLDHSEFLSVLRIHLILTFSWNKLNYRIPYTPTTTGAISPGKRSISADNKRCDAGRTTTLPIAAAAATTASSLLTQRATEAPCMLHVWQQLSLPLYFGKRFYFMLSWVG